TFHGSDLIGFYSKKKRYEYITPLFRLAMRFVSWRADQIILVANHLSKYINRRDYHVIPCGIDLKLFQPQAQELARQKLGLPYKKKLVIFVGNIHRPVKRYDLA